MYDAVIIGGGPAGCAAAITLRLRDKRVALVEKSHFPRHKVCGEFLTARCRGALRELGVMDRIDALNPPQISDAVLATPGQALRAPFQSNGHGLPFGVSRYALDAILLDRATELGVEVLQPALARGFHELQGRAEGGIETQVDCENSSVSLTSRVLLIADGKIRGLLPDDDTAAGTVDQVGIKSHLAQVCFERQSVELYGFPGGYVGLSPIESRRANVCAAVDLATYRSLGNNAARWFEFAMKSNPRFAKRVDRAHLTNDWLVTPLPRYNYRPVKTPGVIALGTAAAAFDPIIGEGIWMALSSGMRTAQLLLEGDRAAGADSLAIPRESQRHFAHQFRIRNLSAKLLVGLSRSPLLSDASIRVLRRAPWLVRLLMSSSGK